MKTLAVTASAQKDINRFLPKNRTQRLVEYMNLFNVESKSDSGFPRRAGYVAERLASTKQKFNEALLREYPRNFLHVVTEDELLIKPERTKGQDFLGVDGMDAQNIPTVTATLDNFKIFMSQLRKIYTKKTFN